MTWPFLAVGAALFYGLQGAWTKRLTRRLPPIVAAWAIFAFAFALPVLAVYLWVRGVPAVEPVFRLALLGTCSIGLLSFYLGERDLWPRVVGTAVTVLGVPLMASG